MPPLNSPATGTSATDWHATASSSATDAASTASASVRLPSGLAPTLRHSARNPPPHRLIQVAQVLRIGRAADDVAAALELGSQRPVVVDLAVEDHVDGRVLVGHRLVPGGREVDEGQPAVHQLAVRIAILTAPIGAAVGEQRVGAAAPLRCRRQTPGVEPPRYAAHARAASLRVTPGPPQLGRRGGRSPGPGPGPTRAACRRPSWCSGSQQETALPTLTGRRRMGWRAPARPPARSRPGR